MATSDVLNRKTRGLNSVREMLRRSCTSLVADSVIGKTAIDIEVNPLLKLAIEPTVKQASRYLTWASATGHFSTEDLNYCVTTMQANAIYATCRLHFHLASLYLQVGEHEQALRLLSDANWDSEDITWFAALMLFARTSGYTIPLIDRSDLACLDYLDSHLSQSCAAIDTVLQGGGHIAVVGNAPGEKLDINTSASLIYFNDYDKNPRLSGEPYVHVVTPSWDIASVNGGSHLLLTGNSIFHRRSRVWRRFSHCPDYQSIGCFPRALWSRLYLQLQAPPSAGLLAICFLAEQENIHQSQVTIEGFSSGRPQLNHEFDRVPPSARHNWEQEAVLRKQVTGEISIKHSG